MSQALVGHVAVASKQIVPGSAHAFSVAKDELLQIITVDGRQAAEMAAYRSGDVGERLSTAATRVKNKSILVQKGNTLYSSRYAPLLQLVEDTVGRHDLLMATSEPTKPAGHALDGDEEKTHPFLEAVNGSGVGLDHVVEPVNWFVNVTIKAKGELEVSESLAEPDDYVLLKAFEDLTVIVGARPKMAGSGIAPSPLLIRVFRPI